MTVMEMLAALLAGILIPYVVALIKGKTISGNWARWLAIGLCVASGIVIAFIDGIPTSPAEVLMCIFSAIGAMQAAYAIFESVGVTCAWLKALSDIRKPSKDIVVERKNQALEDKEEEKVRKGTDES